MSLMGIDVGTTGCKVIAFGEKGKSEEHKLAKEYKTWQQLW